MDDQSIRLRQLECHCKWKLKIPFSNKTVQKINDNLTDWMKTAKPDIQELSFLLLGYIYMTGLEDGLYEVNLLKAEAYLSEAKEISQSITEKTPFYLFNALEAHIYHMLGQIENCESRLELAEALWEEIKNDPKQMAWLHGARGFALFECAFQNYEEALHSFDEGLKLNPEEPLWHYMKGLILARLRRNKKNENPTQDELESLYKAISLSNEDNADYIITYTLSLSSIWFNNKRDNSLKKKILGYLEKLQKCENTAYILLNCSKVYRYLGNKGEMKKCLLQADNITEGKNGHILHQLGLYFWRMERDFEKAKEYLKKSGIHYAAVDYLLLKRSNNEISSETYLSELSKFEKLESFCKSERARIKVYKGKELQKQDRIKDAKEAFMEATRLDPELITAREAYSKLQNVPQEDIVEE